MHFDFSEAEVQLDFERVKKGFFRPTANCIFADR
jgi:hypothetical protein